MQIFADTFSLAPSVQALARTLQQRCEEFEHTRLARYVCLWAERELFLRGNPKSAIIAVPQVQGVNRWLFDFLVAQFCRPILGGEDPEFLIYFDRALWDGLKDPEKEERLVYHELCHIAPRLDDEGLPAIGDDGRPKLKLVDHDCEVFDNEVWRYPAHVTGIEHTLVSYAEGQRARRSRQTA